MAIGFWKCDNMKLDGRSRVLALLAGQTVDRTPVMPITMMFAADCLGVKYGAYASDFRILVEAQIKTAATYDFDYVSVISDPAREAADSSASRPGRPQDASIFSDLVVQLATQAAMYLGLVTDPLGPQFPTDLRAARQMIDIISMLKEKTAGNLTPDEGVLLERVLTDLRMQFVSMSSPPRP